MRQLQNVLQGKNIKIERSFIIEKAIRTLFIILLD